MANTLGTIEASTFVWQSKELVSWQFVTGIGVIIQCDLVSGELDRGADDRDNIFGRRRSVGWVFCKSTGHVDIRRGGHGGRAQEQRQRCASLSFRRRIRYPAAHTSPFRTRSDNLVCLGSLRISQEEICADSLSDSIKIGTLNHILADVAGVIGITKSELVDRLFRG